MDTQLDSSGDSGKDLGTALVREAGCGVVYLIEFEDREEMHYQIDLDRTEAERLYVILGRMLGKDTLPAVIPPTNWTTLPPATIPNWVMPAGKPWFGIGPPPPGW
jgi:hypothetical protein